MNIKLGDVVKLKSGGPKMTVREITNNRAYCDWFDGTNSKKDNFPLTSLELAET